MKPASLRPFLPRPAIRRRQILPSQHYASQAPGPPTLQVFNDEIKHLQRERAAADVEGSRKVDYLRDEVASRLCERLPVNTFPQSFQRGISPYPLTRILNAIFPAFLIWGPMPATSGVLLLCPFQSLHLSPREFHSSHPWTLHQPSFIGTHHSHSTRFSHLIHVPHLAHQINLFPLRLNHSMLFCPPSPSIGSMIFPACSPKSTVS